MFSLRSEGSFEGALVMATMAHEPVQDKYVGPAAAAASSSQLNQSERLSEASSESFRAPPLPKMKPKPPVRPSLGGGQLRRAGGFLESTPVDSQQQRPRTTQDHTTVVANHQPVSQLSEVSR